MDTEEFLGLSHIPLVYDFLVGDASYKMNSVSAFLVEGDRGFQTFLFLIVRLAL